MPAEIAALRLCSQFDVAIKDRSDVLGDDRDDLFVDAIEEDIGAHQDISVTESLPAAASWMAAIFWPGVQVKYSARSAGK